MRNALRAITLIATATALLGFGGCFRDRHDCRDHENWDGHYCHADHGYEHYWDHPDHRDWHRE